MRVVERMSELADNDTKKMLVEFMDDKLNVLSETGGAVFSVLPFVFELFVWFVTAATAAEYDSVIQSWNEKVRWDLVRPTTVIQQLDGGSRVLDTFGGPFKGRTLINARDFQPYIRVMPHSEYPSASACLCQSLVDFAELFVQNATAGAMDSVPLTLTFPAGSSVVEPGVVPSEDITVVFEDLTAYRNSCGQSRLDGGMHFTASVSAGYELCEGIGKQAWEYGIQLLNGQPVPK